MPAPIPTRRPALGAAPKAATALLAFAAALAATSARAEARVERVEEGGQTGGIIPGEYLDPARTAEPDAASSVPGAGSAASVPVSTSAHRGSNENAVASNGKGGIIVGWQDSGTSQCCYAYSADHGVTWNHRCLKPSSPGNGHAGDATAGASPDGALYAVCQDYSVSQVRISHTRDNGKTWSEWKSVQSAPDKPWAGADPHGRIHVAWSDLSRGNSQVAVMYASTLGSTFTREVEITDRRAGISGFFGDYKGLWIDRDDVLITWIDSRSGSSQIYFNRGKGLAAGVGTAVTPGTPGYRHEAVWLRTAPAVDAAGREVGTTGTGRPAATGKYLARPPKGGRVDGE